MTITDIFTLACFLFLIWRGYTRGFIASLLGPIALILGSIVGLVYFAWTKNILVSLCIGLFGPLVLVWIFRFCLKAWNKATNPNQQLHPLSRLCGSLLTLSWGMAMLIITLLLLAMAPPVNKPLKMLYKDIHLSYTYRFIKPLDSTAVDKTSAEDHMKALSEDKRIQDIINDPQIIAAINRKDYAAMIANPKITALMQDPAMIKKMMSIYKKMGQEADSPSP